MTARGDHRSAVRWRASLQGPGQGICPFRNPGLKQRPPLVGVLRQGVEGDDPFNQCALALGAFLAF
jgi:hypothetical protein